MSLPYAYFIIIIFLSFYRVLRVRIHIKQEIRSVERGYLSHCFKSRSRDLGQQFNKKDGYRQQNVSQRQKLISIIDYDVCMTFY